MREELVILCRNGDEGSLGWNLNTNLIEKPKVTLKTFKV